ncbi:hypothetical protein IG631_21758 [Alternaria alternata]|nr:hypothetical protein IG631_21758 [Alternaria alternata]
MSIKVMRDFLYRAARLIHWSHSQKQAVASNVHRSLYWTWKTMIAKRKSMVCTSALNYDGRRDCLLSESALQVPFIIVLNSCHLRLLVSDGVAGIIT